MSFLLGVADHGLLYMQDTLKDQLKGFCDADYAGDVDTRRSRSGYVFLLGTGVIAWSS